jgi:ubiquitin carboxyl-terminal hydrolase 14
MLADLIAIVSHKGRSADSGHYMAWVRRSGDDWLVFDDDSVSESEFDTSSCKPAPSVAHICSALARLLSLQLRLSTYCRISKEAAMTTCST